MSASTPPHLPGLGPKSLAVLAAAGIHNRSDLELDAAQKAACQ
jgi:hypothetical protein